MDRCHGSVKAVSPRHAQRLVRHCASQLPLFQLPCWGRVTRTDNVRCTAAEEQLVEAKEVQLSQPSSTGLLMISYAGLTQGPAPPPSSRSLADLLISPGTLFEHCRSQLVPNMSTEGRRLAYPLKHHASRGPRTSQRPDSKISTSGEI